MLLTDVQPYKSDVLDLPISTKTYRWRQLLSNSQGRDREYRPNHRDGRGNAEAKCFYRCKNYSHMARNCRGPDSGGSYLRCGIKGQSAMNCTSKSQCFLYSSRKVQRLYSQSPDWPFSGDHEMPGNQRGSPEEKGLRRSTKRQVSKVEGR